MLAALSETSRQEQDGLFHYVLLDVVQLLANLTENQHVGKHVS